ncbi:MAG TPA: PTS sugar transporter subunit IIA [Bacteroidota bacterium]|jgi:fructose-specific phosphotransferase system IIA component|nr:PTS sugar transporter subunit IIA [Bacteroidota bacterium]
MKISDVLEVELISNKIPGTDKEEVLNNMIELVSKSSKVRDKEKIRDAIFNRERIMSTGVGKGFAIPHGKTDGITDMVAAFGITENEIDFESLDGEPVRLIFLLVGKENLVGPHLKLLSRISRLLNSEDFRTKLLNAKSPQEIYNLFESEEKSYFEK